MTVAERMVTRPKLHPATLTVAELRELFRDDHLHMVLVVERGRLVAALERADLALPLDDDLPVAGVGQIEGRTVEPGAPLDETAIAMRARGRRRLAVVQPDLTVSGLLCLKASGLGFCSDADVEQRAALFPGGSRLPVGPQRERLGASSR